MSADGRPLRNAITPLSRLQRPGRSSPARSVKVAVAVPTAAARSPAGTPGGVAGSRTHGLRGPGSSRRVLPGSRHPRPREPTSPLRGIAWRAERSAPGRPVRRWQSPWRHGGRWVPSPIRSTSQPVHGSGSSRGASRVLAPWRAAGGNGTGAWPTGQRVGADAASGLLTRLGCQVACHFGSRFIPSGLSPRASAITAWSARGCCGQQEAGRHRVTARNAVSVPALPAGARRWRNRPACARSPRRKGVCRVSNMGDASAHHGADRGLRPCPARRPARLAGPARRRRPGSSATRGRRLRRRAGRPLQPEARPSGRPARQRRVAPCRSPGGPGVPPGEGDAPECAPSRPCPARALDAARLPARVPASVAAGARSSSRASMAGESTAALLAALRFAEGACKDQGCPAEQRSAAAGPGQTPGRPPCPGR